MPASAHSARDGVAAAQYQDGERRTGSATWPGTLRTAGTGEVGAEAAGFVAEVEAWYLVVVEAAWEVVHLAWPRNVEAQSGTIRSSQQEAAAEVVLASRCHRTPHRLSPALREVARRAEKATRSVHENAGKGVLAIVVARGCRAGKMVAQPL